MIQKRFLIAAIFALFFASCQKEENLQYSCNPDVNQWVIENKSEYANISRVDFSQLDINNQLGLYRSFESNQKIKLWKEKLEYLTTSVKLTKTEKKYLLELYNFIKPEHFDNIESKQEFHDYAAKWEKEARATLNWGDKEIFLYTHTLMTESEFNIAIERRANKQKNDHEISEIDTKPDCECYYSIYCGLDGYCDEKIECVSGKGGCGIFGNSNCTGMCD